MKMFKFLRSTFLILVTVFLTIVVMQCVESFHCLRNELSLLPPASNLSVIAQNYSKNHSSGSNNFLNPHSSETAPRTMASNLLSEEEQKDFPGATVVESAEVDGPEPNQSTRIKILKTDFKYPFIRSEEVVDNNTGTVVDHEEMAADHALVTLPPETDPEVFFRNLGPGVASVNQITPDARVYKVHLASPSIGSLPELLGTIAQNGETHAVSEPDLVHHVIDMPEHITPSKDWGLMKIGGELNQFTAASKQSRASSKIVAIIDTGIRYTHHELSSNMWHNPLPTSRDIYGWNAVEKNGDPKDDNGHGTFCAGIIGATDKNNMGMVGIVPVVQLMACKGFDKNGVGVVSDEISCIHYAGDHGAKVLNCSWGGGASGALYDALSYAQTKGVICVAAAGNASSKNPSFYPAAYGIGTVEGKKLDNIVSVAASTLTDELASFSNYGVEEVPLAAPGVNICSTFNESDDSYAIGSGTSMAAPYVSGALILLETQFPKRPYQSYEQRLYDTADKVSGLSGYVAFGRLNVTKALTQ